MSATVRAKGQDCRVTFTSPDGTVDILNVSGIKSWDGTFKFKKLEEGYQGEFTQRYDEIFMGCDGSIEAHVSGGAMMTFVQAIKDRAQRTTIPEGEFSMVVSVSFGTGQRARILFPDVHFGDVPFKSSARDEFVTISFDFSCSEGLFIPA